MAKKQTLASEIGSALGAVAARAEQLITSTTAKKTTTPAAKRTTAAKHSTAAPKKAAPKAKAAIAEPKTKAASIEAKPIKGATAPIEISHEAIAIEAYLFAEARGFQGGDAAADWIRAEEELKRRAKAARA